MKTIDAIKFWGNQGEIVRIKDLPAAISNRFILDLKASDIWEGLNPQPSREVETLPFSFNECDKELTLQFDGRTAIVPRASYGLYAYQLFTSSGKACCIQKPYAEYFIRRYPNCSFWFQNDNMPIAVEFEHEVVGIVMPVIERAYFYPKKDIGVKNTV